MFVAETHDHDPHQGTVLLPAATAVRPQLVHVTHSLQQHLDGAADNMIDHRDRSPKAGVRSVLFGHASLSVQVTLPHWVS